jgi:hypothetical protein
MCVGWVLMTARSYLLKGADNMPRQRVSKQLPRAMTQLAVIMESKSLPIEVDRIFEVVREGLKNKDNRVSPITIVNRKLGQLKRRHPDNLIGQCQRKLT